MTLNYMKFVALFGNKKEHMENLKVAISMLVVTVLYEYISYYFIPTFEFNIYEFVGTWSGLVCVWLSRTQNILCWPWGILSSAMLGVFFGQIGLPGQQWLNWVYFMIIQIWAWPYWVFGGKKQTTLPVTFLNWKNRCLTLVAIFLGTWAVYVLIGYFTPGSVYPVLDALVVAASVIAQFLLGKKKVESWIFWLGPVNLLSIILFALAGAYTVTALYIAFFVHAAFALKEWNHDAKN